MTEKSGVKDVVLMLRFPADVEVDDAPPEEDALSSSPPQAARNTTATASTDAVATRVNEPLMSHPY
jgi:hypothetical protein